jgi:hypothetical protein
MISRATSFGVGLMLSALAAWAALGQERVLCSHGHPVHRAANVTYGGLAALPGFQRDHHIPLCLGGADELSNVRYQPLAEAKVKDREEWQLCEAVCRGDVSLEAAVQQMLEDWP